MLQGNNCLTNNLWYDDVEFVYWENFYWEGLYRIVVTILQTSGIIFTKIFNARS